ncbi:MFS transporter [Rhodanobacter aciditrophus]|uniref:MFS transporter n=2 Tax=Bacteria TaxID=2 RepID=A0ABW4AYP7_9GAMM
MQLPTTFRALANSNYRLWLIGAFISNIGTWLQRTAQDWIVIADLSDQNASAVGIVVMFQFLPQILLLPLTGWAADRLDRRKLLLTTQICMAILALILGVLALTNMIVLWHVYACALALGIVAAFDAPARHAFVSDVVSENEVPNAVALNSVSFNSARLIGPAIAGLLIALVGAGWVFMINLLSFIPLLSALVILGGRSLAGCETKRETSHKMGFLDGFRYLGAHREMIVMLVMSSLVCGLGMNFSVYLSAMTVHVFGGHAGQYGLLISMMAIGSISGALITASRPKPNFGFMVCLPAIYAMASVLVAWSPNYLTFSGLLIVLGLSLQLFTTSSNTFMQTSTSRAYRGRVMAIVLATMMGSTALGAPFVGWVADTIGARWSIGVGAVFGMLAFCIGGTYYLRYYRHQEKAA